MLILQGLRVACCYRKDEDSPCPAFPLFLRSEQGIKKLDNAASHTFHPVLRPRHLSFLRTQTERTAAASDDARCPAGTADATQTPWLWRALVPPLLTLAQSFCSEFLSYVKVSRQSHQGKPCFPAVWLGPSLTVTAVASINHTRKRIHE